MSIWWDGCNKWLYFGTKQMQANQFTLMFDNWLLWFKKTPHVREWTLFSITWDNGAWWADLPDVENKVISKMNGKMIENENWIKRSGQLLCFVQIIILGIGLRYWYNKGMTIFHEGKN